MNQIGFHDWMRTVIPGIALTALCSFCAHHVIGLKVGVPEISLLGVFVGLILDPLFAKGHRKDSVA